MASVQEVASLAASFANYSRAKSHRNHDNLQDWNIQTCATVVIAILWTLISLQAFGDWLTASLKEGSRRSSCWPFWKDWGRYLTNNGLTRHGLQPWIRYANVDYVQTWPILHLNARISGTWKRLFAYVTDIGTPDRADSRGTDPMKGTQYAITHSLHRT